MELPEDQRLSFISRTGVVEAPPERVFAVLEDPPLLADLLPDFEAEHNVDLDVVAVGTGQALKLGEDGNADVLMVHARAREDAFMEAGHGVRREDLMYNDFVIVGPADDPAGVKGMGKAPKAMAKIAEAGATFVSRGYSGELKHLAWLIGEALAHPGYALVDVLRGEKPGEQG